MTLPWFPYRLVAIAQALTPGLVARFSGMSAYRPGSFPPGDPGGVPDAYRQGRQAFRATYQPTSTW